jgi:hypothetical protein
MLTSHCSLCNDRSTSDVVVKFDRGEKLFAHKHVLAARSKYFEKAFISGFSVC